MKTPTNQAGAAQWLRWERLSGLVRVLEVDMAGASSLTIARCVICHEGFGRGGSPCWSCVRGELERRYGLVMANEVCGAVTRQRLLAGRAL